MDDRDMSEILLRLRGAQTTLGKLQTLAQIYRDGKIGIVGFVLALTTGQKTALKTEFDSSAAKLDAMLDTLPTPTGQVGAVNQAKLNEVIEVPARAVNILNETLSQVTQLAESHQPQYQPDGTLRVSYGDVAAKSMADALALVRDSAKFFSGVLKSTTEVAK